MFGTKKGTKKFGNVKRLIKPTIFCQLLEPDENKRNVKRGEENQLFSVENGGPSRKQDYRGRLDSLWEIRGI